jgi:type I restriction enzyme R subunit
MPTAWPSRCNNLYVRWCKERGPDAQGPLRLQVHGANGADMIEPMRGSGERCFIACTVDLLATGVDIERLNAVVFFRYLQSAIKFYQMVGRGTRIHEETQKYKFWLYDYTGVTDCSAPSSSPSRRAPVAVVGGGGDTGGGGEGRRRRPPRGRDAGQYVVVNAQGRFILSRREGATRRSRWTNTGAR